MKTIEKLAVGGCALAGAYTGISMAEQDYRGNLDDLNRTVEALGQCKADTRDLSLTADGTLACGDVNVFYIAESDDSSVEVDWDATIAAVIDSSRNSDANSVLQSEYPTNQSARYINDFFGALIGVALGSVTGSLTIGIGRSTKLRIIQRLRDRRYSEK